MTGKTNGKMLRFPPGEPRRRACVLALPSRGPGPSVTPRAVAASLFVTVLFANFPIGTSRPPATRSLNLVPHPLPKRFGVSPPPSGRGGRRAEAAAGSTREGREGEERHADRRARAGGRRSEDPVGDRGRGRIGAGGARRAQRAGGRTGGGGGGRPAPGPSERLHAPTPGLAEVIETVWTRGPGPWWRSSPRRSVGFSGSLRARLALSGPVPAAASAPAPAAGTRFPSEARRPGAAGPRGVPGAGATARPSRR